MAERSVTIAGAGIAGLTAALSFAASGFSVTVFERADELQEAGAGLQISPNATRVLKKLGVLQRLEGTAVEPSAVTLKRASDLAELARIPLGKEAERRWGAPYLVAHRADLQRALLDTVHATPTIRLHLRAEAVQVTFPHGRPTLTVKKDGKLLKEECDLVVGADGVWSGLRLASGGGESHFSGHIAFRTVLSANDFPRQRENPVFAKDIMSAFLAPGFHMVAYPLRGGQEVNLVAVTRGEAMEKGWTNEVDTAPLTTALQQTAPALARAAKAADWRAWPIHTVSTKADWAHPGGLALIGDAAHALTPYAAQGAAMAIEDAALLAGLAARANNIPAMLERFERLRRPRLARVARRASFNRFVWHARGPVALARNFALRLRSGEELADDLNWLYGHDVEDEIPARQTHSVQNLR